MGMTPDQKRIAELEALVEELQWRLDDITGAHKAVPLGITPMQFALAEVLARRAPLLAHKTALQQVAVRNVMEVVSPGALVKVQVCLLRPKLKAHGIEIETIWGAGYRMTKDSAAKWRALVAEYNPQMEDAA